MTLRTTVLVSGTTWLPPADAVGASIKVICIGPGGNGGLVFCLPGGGGGGGGVGVKNSFIVRTATPIPIQIGSPGTDTFFNTAGTVTGGAGVSGSASVGGSGGGGVGDVTHNGGNGANAGCGTGGGGGGAAGDSGDGGAGIGTVGGAAGANTGPWNGNSPGAGGNNDQGGFNFGGGGGGQSFCGVQGTGSQGVIVLIYQPSSIPAIVRPLELPPGRFTKKRMVPY